MKTKFNTLFLLITVVTLILGIWLAGAQAQPPDPPPAEPDWDAWQTLPPEIRVKVDPRLLAELRGEILPAHLGGGVSQPHVAPPDPQPLEQTRFLVYLTGQTGLKAIERRHFATKTARRQAVFNALLNTARAAQGPVKTLLEGRLKTGDVSGYQPFYIFNGFAVEGNLDTIIELARRDDVARIAANYPLLPLWNEDEAAGSPAPASGLGGLDPDNWNIDLVDADRVWNELGVTGEGAVVGGFDTGVDWTAPALQTRYRGYAPGGSDHNYNWFEPDAYLHADGNLGPSESTVPWDCYGHGTHTMGTMVGDGGTPDTKIGMAPGAKWVAVPGICGNTMPGGVGDDIGGIKAFQWFLCPTDLSGDLSTADCSKAPDAINNSWGSANPADDTFRPAIQALRAAGVAPVFAAGNPDAGAGSIGTPASIPEAITVGATDSSDAVAYFSGRGPSFYEGEQKPELSAPGVSVKSVVDSTYYDWWSGTSMAAPHVAGLVALMVSADLQDGYRDLNVDELERAMADTAVDLGSPGPDDDYGYGRIDAFNAVRWVLSAGDLRGTVRDAVFDIAVSRAGVTGAQAATGDTFTAPTNATGQYSVTVPAGMYDISVTAWGYNSAAFHNQPVFSGSLSLADFALTPIPRATLSGQVLSGTIPVSRATVYVAANPNAQTTAGADGTYSLLLPVGDHQLVVKAEGYHILTETVSVGPGGAAHSFTLLAAPTILLVNADTFDGWFYGWPVDNYFRWALDKHHYLYDEWRIQYLYFNDTQTMPDGSAGYGVPSATTLNQYDVVIWAHAGYSPSYIGADDELAAFLSGGGRLILSGQDIAARDYWTTYFKQYLHADLASYSAAGEGEAVSGRYFLDGHHLKLTNASLYGYPNGIWSFSPDAVAPLDGAATPILSYDNGSGAAALAIAPCDADYRVVYFALGYENIAARAANRDPAIAGALRDSIAWAAGSDSLPEVLFTAGSAAQTGPPGSQVSYPAQLVNAQEITASFELVTGGNLWPTRILSGSTVITRTAALAPCQLQELTAQVDILSAASAGQRDTVAITATRVAGGGQPSAGITLTTVAFPDWQFEPPMPNIRYRLGVTAPPGEPFVYAIGGGNRIYATATNRRFDACTGVWETLAPLPERRMNINAAAVNGAIYVAGGYTADGAFHDTTFAYNPAADTWAAVAPLPQPLSGVALAGAGGSLYAFGGGADTYSDKTYVYNPAADRWAEKAPLPGGPRAYAAAAELNGKIYVVGGWPALSTVEVYDPAGDTWATAAPMNSGRQSPGVTAGPDGYLYVSGGGNRWAGLHSAERYNPATDSWEPVPALHRNRAGTGSAFAAGRIFTVGGVGYHYSKSVESLVLGHAFCESGKSTGQTTVVPGGRISYTVEMEPDMSDLAGASMRDPVPAGTAFAGFGANPAGATYNSARQQVEWSGPLSAGSNPLTFTFFVDVAGSGWALGDPITNTAIFSSGAGIVFTRTAVSLIDMPDFSASAKLVNSSAIRAGQVLTYTLHVENPSAIVATAGLTDPLPPNTSFIPGSLTYTLGTARFDPARNAITWTGSLPQHGTYINTGSDYQWGDSDGGGDVPGVTFNWIDISRTGTPVDFDYYGGTVIPLDFDFSFYGHTYPAANPAAGELGVSENGYLTFESNYDPYPDLYDSGPDCPITYYFDPNDTIAPFWSSLSASANGGVYYQLFGAAPRRYLVVQWDNMYMWRSGGTATFQAILFEGSDIIKFQYQWLTTDYRHVVGIENKDASDGITYNTCGLSDQVYDGRAVLFLPPGSAYGPISADITFAAQTAASLPVNSWITNTVAITAFGGLFEFERRAETLVNPVSLISSTKSVDKAAAGMGETLTYRLNLTNTGLVAARGAQLTDTLPAALTFVSGSLSCSSGACGYSSGLVTWEGSVTPTRPVTLTYRATLNRLLPNRSPVVNTARLHNGSGTYHTLTATFTARAPDLGASTIQAEPAQVLAGEAVTYTIYIFNTGEFATPAQLAATLPPSLTYRSSSLVCGRGTCAFHNGTVIWAGTAYLRSLIPVRFQAQTPGWAAVGQVITSTAAITDLTGGAGLTLTATVTITGAADLWVSKTGPGVAAPGGALVYTIHYGNRGPYHASFPAQVIDHLPPGAAYLGSKPPGVYSPTAHSVTWDATALGTGGGTLGTFGSLAPGISGTLVVTAAAPLGSGLLPYLLTNTAVITTPPSDPDVGNNTARYVTIIGGQVNLLESSKTVAPQQAAQGDALTYTITLKNSGAITATTRITDPLPAGTGFVAGSGTVDGVGAALYNQTRRQVEWQGPVAPGKTVILRFQAQITTPLGIQLTNRVVVSDGVWMTVYRQATARALPVTPAKYSTYLPLVLKK